MGEQKSRISNLNKYTIIGINRLRPDRGRSAGAEPQASKGPRPKFLFPALPQAAAQINKPEPLYLCPDMYDDYTIHIYASALNYVGYKGKPLYPLQQ